MSKLMKGLSWSSLKKHYALIPLFTILGGGLLIAVIYPLRVALKSPDVSWLRKSNPEPFKEYENKQYKFYSNIDHSKKSERPEF